MNAETIKWFLTGCESVSEMKSRIRKVADAWDKSYGSNWGIAENQSGIMITVGGCEALVVSDNGDGSFKFTKWDDKGIYEV